MRDRLVVGSLDNCEEVVLAEECVLRDDGAAEIVDLLVDFGETFRMGVECLTAFGCERTEQRICGHVGSPSVPSFEMRSLPLCLVAVWLSNLCRAGRRCPPIVVNSTRKAD